MTPAQPARIGLADVVDAQAATGEGGREPGADGGLAHARRRAEDGHEEGHRRLRRRSRKAATLVRFWQVSEQNRRWPAGEAST